MIVSRGRFWPAANISFEEEAADVEADIVRHLQRTRPVPGTVVAPFYTLLVDLRQDHDMLMAKLSRGTRYEIRRATDGGGLAYEVADRGRGWEPCCGEALSTRGAWRRDG
jgi:hypothetical protein